MCLGTVCCVVETRPDRSALVVDGDRRSAVSLITLAEPVGPGDWLLVHSGLALAVVTAEEAEEARAIRARLESEPT